MGNRLDLSLMKKVVVVLTGSIIVGTTRIPFRRSLSGSSGIQQSLALLVLFIEVRYLLVVLVMSDMKRVEL
jgi:hypothetical protein